MKVNNWRQGAGGLFLVGPNDGMSSDMSFFDARGCVATIDRSPGRGVCFVDGAHTRSRGVVDHRNDAGDEPGATLILTFRADASHAFDYLSPAERLFAHAGIALLAAH